jgi:hypothetical protein
MGGVRGGRRTAGAIAVSALVLFAGACGGHHPRSAAEGTSTSTSASGALTSTTTTSSRGRKVTRKVAAHVRRAGHSSKGHARKRAALRPHRLSLCPLTGTSPPGGHVRRRPAIAVKVENLPEARPQWGLDKADIVFEEPVEGGITRFIAVYQCREAARIEPVRSGRLVDPKILEPMGKMLFAYAGAIQPMVNEVRARRSLLSDVGMFVATSAYWRDPARPVPHNLVTSTSALYAAAAALHYPTKPPTAIFSYGRPAPGGTPAAAVSIFDPLDVTTWTWRRDTGLWYRSYSDTGPALQGDGTQITASNVVVMLVEQHPTPWVEDTTGTHENDLALKGSGPAWVFRDGRQYFGHWERPKLDHPTVFIEKDGTRVRLTPGNTWVELVPDGLRISVKP